MLNSPTAPLDTAAGSGLPLIDILWFLPDFGIVKPPVREMLQSEAPHCREAGFRFQSGADYEQALRSGRPPWGSDSRKPDALVLFGSLLETSCDLFSLVSAARDQFACLVAAWTTEDPFEFDRNNALAGIMDYFFTNDRNTAAYYSHPKVTPLPPAASEAFPTTANVSQYAESDQEWDFVFCGKPSENRLQIIDGLKPILARHRTLIIGPVAQGEQTWPAARFGGITFRESLPYGEVAGIYQQSRIVLNLSHLRPGHNRLFDIIPSTPAARTYEIAAMCVAQAAFYDRPELVLDFPDGEIALFSSVQEFETLTDRLLNDSDARRGMADRARLRVWVSHLYRHRLQTLVSVLRIDPSPPH